MIVLVANNLAYGQIHRSTKQDENASMNYRTLVSLYLALLREKKLFLAEDAAIHARIVQLFVALCENFPKFASECKPTINVEVLQNVEPLAAGQFVAQSYALSGMAFSTVILRCLSTVKKFPAESGSARCPAV